MTMISGKHIKEGIIKGTELVGKEMEFINAINVYPVADGDTGTNMYNTLKGVAAAVEKVESDSVSDVMQVVAEAALESARGNSGIILSQYLWGFYEAVEGRDTLDRHGFAEALSVAKDWAYQAVTNPVEGTILTVMRAAAESAREHVKTKESVHELLHHTYQDVLRALESTPEMLKKLGKPKIIDSGAYGFTLIYEGIVRSMGVDLNGYRVRGMRAEREHHEGSSLFCTNYMVELNNGTNIDEIRAAIESLGDSIVVVGGHGKVKVHIHSAEPERVKERLLQFGRITQERIDQIW